MDLRSDHPDDKDEKHAPVLPSPAAKGVEAEEAAGENAHKSLYKGSNLTVAQFSLLTIDHQVGTLRFTALSVLQTLWLI